MASNQPTQALNVIPSDTINIPEPDAYITGNNSAGTGTTITDASANFLGVSNPANTGYSNRVTVGDVIIHEAAGPVLTLLTVVSIIDNNNIQVSASITGGRYQIYRANRGDVNLNKEGFSLFVGGAGNISVIPASSDQTVVLENIPDSSFIPLQVKRVNQSGTTATKIIALR
tara:strand:+ start:650 stop:1165 length:516 start_codon:yes stop_codon:yes gene_type:complete